MKRVKKCYLSDPSIPVRRHTFYRREAQGKKCAEQETDESSPGDGEKQNTEALDANGNVLAPDLAQDHDDCSQYDSEIEEELSQNKNGGPDDITSRNINTYFSCSSEDINNESDTESNDSLNFNSA